MKYLIAGLGNIGPEYAFTRHNIGFLAADALAAAHNTTFSSERYAARALARIKGRIVYIIKPSTYMNLSGKALKYWLDKENIPLENLLVIVDDLALPFGTIRIKPKGSDAGHNGLSDIIERIGSQDFARMRFGIGSDYPKGKQSDYVLGQWSDDEQKILGQRIDTLVQATQSFVLQGLAPTMNAYNRK